MSNLSQFLALAQGPRAVTANGPGSNGYWRRKAYGVPGAYRFIVQRTGRHKLSGLGGGSGGRAFIDNAVTGGSGGGISIGEYDLVKGDVVLVTVGAGGAPGIFSGAAPQDGGTTTIVCAARGVNITIPGGRFSAANVRPTGGTLVNNIGGNSEPSTNLAASARGGASSGTPFSDGFASTHAGGSGWGGSASTQSGTSSNTLLTSAYNENNALLNSLIPNPGSPFWDFDDILGNGTSQGNSPPVAGNGGGGGANISNAGSGGFGGFGGGGGSGTDSTNGRVLGGSGGHGAGGGTGSRSTSGEGGKGGDGYVLIHWDEVI